MIWDFIRDFFVQYLFGGVTSGGDFYGGVVSIDADDYSPVFNDGLFYKIGEDQYGTTRFITIGDWLSTTATIICMALIAWFCIWLVIWLFKLVSSAFLLRK